jgi:hypothetical protein
MISVLTPLHRVHLIVVGNPVMIELPPVLRTLLLSFRSMAPPAALSMAMPMECPVLPNERMRCWEPPCNVFVVAAIVTSTVKSPVKSRPAPSSSQTDGTAATPAR